jgi:hypothetical protein
METDRNRWKHGLEIKENMTETNRKLWKQTETGGTNRKLWKQTETGGNR